MSTATAPRTGTLADLTPGIWTVDPSHSTVGFTARHLMITKVHGHFTDFDGTVSIADDPLASSVEANVRLASVDTGSADRDAHLRTADFFDVEQHPEMTLRSTGYHARPRRRYVLAADLTIAGQTHPVVVRARVRRRERRTRSATPRPASPRRPRSTAATGA